jgi:hypothetical protein
MGNDQLEVLKLQLTQREELYLSGKSLPFPAELNQRIHDLAEERDEPARDLFIDLLVQRYPDPLIMESLVFALGFHWTDVKEVALILISLLKEHKSRFVRMHCAGALGLFGIADAIQPLVCATCGQDGDEDVAAAAQSSLMELAHLPMAIRERVATQMVIHCNELKAVKDIDSLSRLLNQLAGVHAGDGSQRNDLRNPGSLEPCFTGF